ncbi:MAG: winged helix-turn-helix domain-containing protein [Solirubrobacterales bacterium]
MPVCLVVGGRWSFFMCSQSSHATPIECAPQPGGRAEVKASMGGGRRSFDWATLVSQRVHPVQVAIVEALERIERPLSATEMSRMFGVTGWYVGIVAYHVSKLVEDGVIEVKSERAVRGALESFVFFTGPR